MSLIRNYHYEDKKIIVPIGLYTDKYEADLRCFLLQCQTVMSKANEGDIIKYGMLIRYKEVGGNILGTSYNFYIRNLSQNTINIVEFEYKDTLNISDRDNYYYSFYVKNNIKDIGFLQGNIYMDDDIRGK